MTQSDTIEAHMGFSHNRLLARVKELEAELAEVKKFGPKEGDQCWSLGHVKDHPNLFGSWVELRKPTQQVAAYLKWRGPLDIQSEEMEQEAAFILAAINGTHKTERDVADQFQDRVDKWVLECFGLQTARDKPTRNHRFLEEALELSQAGDCTKEEALQLVDYVFSRPKGELRNEIGGVAVTLNALACAYDMSVQGCADQELRRISTPEMTKKIAEKSANKPKFSPLPQKKKMDFRSYDENLRLLDLAARSEKNDEYRKTLYDLIEKFKNENERVDNRPICSADGCSERESCGSYCRDNGNFDSRPKVEVVRSPKLEANADIIRAVYDNINQHGSLKKLLDSVYGTR